MTTLISFLEQKSPQKYKNPNILPHIGMDSHGSSYDEKPHCLVTQLIK